VGHRTALPAKNTTLADLADINDLIICRFQRGFFCGVRKEKGARSFAGENVKKLNGTVISFATVPSGSKDHSNSIWTEL